ncbi:hypothetical protein EDB84DRAFT_237097 [Lactarius hengduanensis]|nr:hypothetical protein EDB84DRAFT_237097 [Lactarius hengduanensis]
MVIECYSQERSCSTFYGLTSERFCKLNRVWCECHERTFEMSQSIDMRRTAYVTLRGFLAISWAILQTIKMNEDDTTNSSRIFVKITMQEVTGKMGLPTLKENFADPEIKALRDQLLHECRTWCSHRRNARASHSEMCLVLSWSNAVQCWRPNHRLPTVPRIPTASSDTTSSDSDSDSDATDGPRDRDRRRRSPSPPRRPQQDSPRRRRDDSRSPSPPPRPRRDEPRPRRDDSRSPSPPRSRRNVDRRDDARGSHGRDRRESPARYRRRSVSDSGSPPRRRYDCSRERSPPPPPRESARDRDRDRDYDRRRDDSRDRYRDRRR